ncbi:hypothetical protein AB4Z17_07910, partial [Paenibacillus sp. TAF43_2]|uniref:hypothetical protein n=1 Tax=Paenibacillus sp. TAF43_2 TaxID=3233069 RepID=UPI003F956CB2
MLKKWMNAMLVLTLLSMLALPAASVSAHDAVSIEDALTDNAKMFASSPNWTFDNSNPQFFGGDESRAVRTSTTTQYAVYKLDGIQSFA